MAAERADWTTHTLRVDAPAGVVYTLIADSENWPLYFSENIHVERLEFDGERERLRMWSVLGGRLESCTLWRRLDPVRRRIDYRQQPPAAPLDAMTGVLTVRDEGAHASEATLRYACGVAADRAWAARAADRNSRLHIADLKRCAERWTRLDELGLAFEESTRVNGPPELVYDFLYRAADWPGSVPRVDRVDLAEDEPGVQRMTVHRRTGNGAYGTESVRLCFPHAGRIVYKETAPRGPLAAHIGEWSVVPDETGVDVVVRHSVVLREEGVTGVPDGPANLARTRAEVRRTLGRGSRDLLALAKLHAESAIRML